MGLSPKHQIWERLESWEFPDSHRSNPDGKEIEVAGRVDVQPADGRQVGRLEFPGQPYCCLGLQPGHIAQYLAKVSMISVVQLIFDHHPAAIDGETGQYVCGETIHPNLAVIWLDGNADNPRQSLEVILKPWV